MNICIFCSAEELEEKYKEPTRQFVKLLAQNGHHLVFGGSDKGLMKIVADTARENGARITAVSFEQVRASLRKDVDEVIMNPDLRTRKAAILEKSDALVTLPGGIGTLDEITEVLELKKHRLHDKNIVVFNIAGFYGGLRTQLLRMENEGFLSRPLSDMLSFADTPEEAYAMATKTA